MSDKEPSDRQAGKGSGIRQRVDWARYYRNRAKIDMNKKPKKGTAHESLPQNPDRVQERP